MTNLTIGDDMSSNQFNNNASNKVVINFNNQPTNFDDATMPNLPVQDVPIIETPRIAEAAQTSTLQAPAGTQQPSANTAEPTAEPEQKGGWFSRMKQGLSKSRKNLTEGLTNILIGGKEIDDELLEEVEDQLLVADIGVNATNRIIKNLTEATARGDLIYSHSLYKALQK